MHNLYDVCVSIARRITTVYMTVTIEGQNHGSCRGQLSEEMLLTLAKVKPAEMRVELPIIMYLMMVISKC